jgi:hypothetical protein
LEKWTIIAPSLESWLDQLAVVLRTIPEAYALAAIAFPVVLAVLSRRSIIIFSVALLSAVVLLLVLKPSFAVTTIAIGAYIGSLIMALSGILARRRDIDTKAELISLRNDMNQLLNAESRRFLAELKSGVSVPEERNLRDPVARNEKNAPT